MIRAVRPTLALVLLLTLAGCELVGAVFEAGFWVGVIAVVLVLVLLVWVVFQFFD